MKEKIIISNAAGAFAAGWHLFWTSRTAREHLAKNLLLLTAVFLLGIAAGKTPGKEKPTKEPEPAKTVETTAVDEEAELFLLNAKASVLDAQAESVAKVLWGIRKSSKDDLRRVVWVICNRVDSPLYPDTVEDVCSQPGQWICYAAGNTVDPELKAIAKTELQAWRDGEYRYLDSSVLWFDWAPGGITFKAEF